jgi:hypothetical protein
VVFSFDALFGLTWRMLTPWLTLTSRLKPLWSFGFWIVIPLYVLVNNVLSLCMIMAVIALLVGRSQSFASLHLYWEGILLVHPTPKNQRFPMCPPYLPMSNLLLQLYLSCFYLSSKLNFLLWENYLVKLSRTWRHIYFLALNKFDHCGSLMLIICLQVVSWELAQSCCYGARFQHCTYSYLVDIIIFCLWMPSGVK